MSSINSKILFLIAYHQVTIVFISCLNSEVQKDFLITYYQVTLKFTKVCILKFRNSKILFVLLHIMK